MEIETVHGVAVLLRRGGGWVLRYPTGQGQREHRLGACADEDVARCEALVWLAGQGIGAGRLLSTAQAAELAGVKPWSWRGLRGRPAPDDRLDGRTPLWRESTVRRYLRHRPGRGRRTDLLRKPNQGG